MELILLPVLLVIIVFFIALASMYNSFVRGRNEAKNAWAQIDVQLKRRHDLIPNLLESVKGYMDHERETLTAITAARASAMGVRNLTEMKNAEGALTDAISKFFAVAENYPQLRANENFLALQEELASTENKIAFARQYYNDSVTAYNIRVQQFPGNMAAGMFGFKTFQFFELTDAAERDVPRVSFR